MKKKWVEKCIYINTDHKIKMMALDIKNKLSQLLHVINANGIYGEMKWMGRGVNTKRLDGSRPAAGQLHKQEPQPLSDSVRAHCANKRTSLLRKVEVDGTVPGLCDMAGHGVIEKRKTEGNMITEAWGRRGQSAGGAHILK